MSGRSKSKKAEGEKAAKEDKNNVDTILHSEGYEFHKIEDRHAKPFLAILCNALQDGEPPRDTFIFANGDKYVGQYISRADKSIQRHGAGQHMLADGTVYEGLWKDDMLFGHGKITYTSGAFYEGEVQGNQYSGQGTYYWPNGASLTATFENSRACGAVDYKDPDGRHWLGEMDGKRASNLRLRLE